ncbi:ribosomal protein S26 (nucleomorph) [Bigelowiella natans]|uniref:40S ribosomal protein S26 n=1 Tax=Bigelowiella natans TaxID=227086 RepID=Q3LVZ2_BIGNA|nr:ribosomal protein S26 [Bigelowiella natans]ABA27374.1 ribosomal protein S26 [Bigelowiella natans]|mmetsp:Transcript_29387/g.47137  ORF Transcript_29387/g.47137 Transcript_29387/m.47137 type:complete len:99 (+) Transcript_29387:1392-1688(+)
MVKKRRNNGRSKNNRGHVNRIHCMSSNALVPRDKAIKKLNVKSLFFPNILKDTPNVFVLPGYKAPKLYSYVFYSISSAFSQKFIKPGRKKYRRIMRTN